MNKNIKNKTQQGMPSSDSGFEMPIAEVLSFIPDAAFVIDRGGKIIAWNNAMERLTGIKKEDMIGKDDYEYSIPFYGIRRPVLVDYIINIEDDASGKYSWFQSQQDIISGETFAPVIGNIGVYLQCIAKPLYDKGGNIIGAIESVREIPGTVKADGLEGKLLNELQNVREELSRTSELLLSSEEKFSMAFKHSPVIISLSTVTEGKYVDVSDNFYSATGWTEDEVIGHTAHDINIWADESDRQLVIKNLKENGCMRELEIKFRKRNGEIRTMLFSGDIIVVGGVPCLLTINSDITDRILTEKANSLQKIELEQVNEELKKSIYGMEKIHRNLLATQQELIDSNRRLLFSEEKFSKAVHLGPVVITLSRVSDGVYVDVSDYFLELTGYTRDEVVGHSAVDLNIWGDRQ